MKRRSGNIYKRFEHAGTVARRLGAWWCAVGRSNCPGAAARTRSEAPSTTTTAGNAYANTKQRLVDIFERFEHAGTVDRRLGTWWCAGGRPSAASLVNRTQSQALSTTTTAGNTYTSMKRRSGNIYKRFEHAGTVARRLGAWW
jgi:hypothetical protein